MSQIYEGISVIIPLYNHERYIAHALESVRSQSVPAEEIIVIDDGSSDASLNVALAYSNFHPEITVWSHPNQGAHYTINSGIQRATGEFVAILNSDDVFHRERFAQCLDIFSSNPELTAVFTGISFIDDEGNSKRNLWYEQAREFYNQVGDLSLALINGNFIMTTSNIIVRRSVFDEIGYFSALRYAHDLDFFLRLLLKGKQIYFHDKPLLAYRLHSTNTINEGVLRVKIEWAAAVAFFIYNLWPHQQNWNYYAKLTKITDQHTLTRLLMYFFAFFRSLPSDKLSCDAFIYDKEFLEFISREVK
jgi:glycosyltransferase involved in cell wall biosynthesis